MTNEEAIEEVKRIDTDLLKTADCGNKTSERMAAGRGRKAMRLAIKALDSQERMQRELKSLDKIAETCDKLEKALELACDNQAYDLDGIEDETCGHCQYCCDGCCHHEDMVDNPEEERPCLERVVEYYKRRAGIDS